MSSRCANAMGRVGGWEGMCLVAYIVLKYAITTLLAFGVCRLTSKPLNSRSLGIVSLKPTSNDLCWWNSILCDTNIMSVLNTIPSTVEIIIWN